MLPKILCLLYTVSLLSVNSSQNHLSLLRGLPMITNCSQNPLSPLRGLPMITTMFSKSFVSSTRSPCDQYTVLKILCLLYTDSLLLLKCYHNHLSLLRGLPVITTLYSKSFVSSTPSPYDHYTVLKILCLLYTVSL